MRAIRRCIAAVTSLLLAAGPAAALKIAPALDGSSWDRWEELQRPLLEFGDTDWVMFLRPDAPNLLPAAPGAVDASAGDDSSFGLLTQVWERR